MSGLSAPKAPQGREQVSKSDYSDIRYKSDGFNNRAASFTAQKNGQPAGLAAHREQFFVRGKTTADDRVETGALLISENHGSFRTASPGLERFLIDAAEAQGSKVDLRK